VIVGHILPLWCQKSTAAFKQKPSFSNVVRSAAGHPRSAPSTLVVFIQEIEFVLAKVEVFN